MSRIGKKTIPLPKGVDVAIQNGTVTVNGPKGTLTRDIVSGVQVAVVDGSVQCSAGEDRTARQQWGLMRVLIDNMVTGVTVGYKKVLDIEGVGYKADFKGDELTISVGYSHPVVIKAGNGISLKTETPTRIIIEGNSKEDVGRVASEMRKIRKPEPYKGKGIRYSGEKIRRKVGKAAGK